MSKHEPYSEEPPIDYSVAYLREYYKRRNRGMIEERNKDLEKRLMEVEKRLGIQNWPDPHLRRCTKCGHEEEGAWDNQCPNLYCSGGFTEKERGVMSKEVLSVEDTVQSREVSVEVVLKDGTEEYRSEGFIKGRYIDSLKQDGGYRDLFNRLFRHLEHDIVEKMRV